MDQIIADYEQAVANAKFVYDSMLEKALSDFTKRKEEVVTFARRLEEHQAALAASGKDLSKDELVRWLSVESLEKLAEL